MSAPVHPYSRKRIAATITRINIRYNNPTGGVSQFAPPPPPPCRQPLTNLAGNTRRRNTSGSIWRYVIYFFCCCWWVLLVVSLAFWLILTSGVLMTSTMLIMPRLVRWGCWRLREIKGGGLLLAIHLRTQWRSEICGDPLQCFSLSRLEHFTLCNYFFIWSHASQARSRTGSYAFVVLPYFLVGFCKWKVILDAYG